MTHTIALRFRNQAPQGESNNRDYRASRALSRSRQRVRLAGLPDARVVVRVCALAAQDAHPKQAVEALEEEVGRLRVTRRQLLTL